MVTSHEPLQALGTLEALLARMCPPMALQLVRTREPLAAEEPIAHEWPLARVPAQMGTQMRRFAVNYCQIK